MQMPDVETLNGIAGFDRLYGLRLLECGKELVRAEVELRPELMQPAGLLHGGVMTAIAESLASIATALSVVADGNVAVGLSNNTSFLRPILTGSVHAEAVRLHRGRSTWVWDVRFSDDDGRLCAVTRMTIAVRPSRSGQAPPLPAI
ncbi:MAG: PaaI family thioesterase [Solirubrobacteraceae bacterium]